MDTPIQVHRPVSDRRFEALRDRAAALLDLPFNDLLFEAHTVHRANFDANRVQRATLLSIKTGGCPEDCGYCPQAARYHTGVENEALMAVGHVAAAARRRQGDRATPRLIGAPRRGPPARA